MNYRGVLLDYLKNYQSDFDEEAKLVSRFVNLLREENCFLRSNLKRHFTGSAWILNIDCSKVLLIHHKKLNKWLQPGGHADGNENVWQVAYNEAKEETGISDFTEFKRNIFDIDIHRIPQHKNVPQHDHYDFRFVFIASDKIPFKKNDEINDIAWVGLNEVKTYTTNNNSMLRMVEKTKRLFL